jgi:FkbM family methyltransferase
MNKIDSINTQYEESTSKISHPAIGDLYCRNVREAQGTLHEICEDQLYFQSGISVSPGDVILDVGANIGVFSLCAAKQGARVYAFEPIPSTFAVLELNVRLHGLESVVTARNIGLSDRTEKKMMFHYPRATVCDAWTPQDNLFKYMADNRENTLDLFKTADPERYGAIVSLGAKSKQQAAIRDIIESAAASHVQIECEFDTLSGVIAHENIEFIDSHIALATALNASPASVRFSLDITRICRHHRISCETKPARYQVTFRLKRSLQRRNPCFYGCCSSFWWDCGSAWR